MTAKELIQQYVTVHADNRWMDASELEALLTEFAGKLKEPASEDLEQAATKYKMSIPVLYPIQLQPAYEGFKAGAKWQKEQMMKDAIEGGCFSYKNGYVHISCDIDEHLTDIKIGDKVKVIIIKE